MSFMGAFSGHGAREANIMGANMASAIAGDEVTSTNQDVTNALSGLINVLPYQQGVLQTGANQALGTLQGAYGTTIGDITGGYQSAIPALQAGYGAAGASNQLGLSNALQQLYGGQQLGAQT